MLHSDSRGHCGWPPTAVAVLVLLSLLAGWESVDAISTTAATAACHNSPITLTAAQLRSIMGGTCANCDTLAPYVNSALQAADMACPLRAAAFLAQVRHETAGLTTFKQPLDNGAGALHALPVSFRAACRDIAALKTGFTNAFPTCVASDKCTCGTDSAAADLVAQAQYAFLTGTWWFTTGSTKMLGAPCGDLRLDADEGLGAMSADVSNRTDKSYGYYKISQCVFGFVWDVGINQRIDYYNTARSVLDTTGPALVAWTPSISNAPITTLLLSWNKRIDGLSKSSVSLSSGSVRALGLSNRYRGEVGVDVTGMKEGTVTLTIAAGAGKDDRLLPSIAASAAFTYDITPPSCVLQCTAPTVPTNRTTVPMLLTCGEALVTSTLTITTSSGSVTGSALWPTPSGTKFVFSVQGAANGALAVQVTDGRDAAGNLLVGTKSVSVVVDNVAPVLSSFSSLTAAVTRITPTPFRLVFNEAVRLTAADIVVANGRLQGWAASSDRKTFDFVVAEAADGVIIVRLARAWDDAWNAVAGTPITRTVQLDTVAPTASWTLTPAPNRAGYLNVSTLAVAFVLSESTNMTSASLQLSAGSASFKTISSARLDFTWSGLRHADVAVAKFPALADVAGNVVIASRRAVSFQVDMVAPTCSVTFPESIAGYTRAAVIAVRVDCSEVVAVSAADMLLTCGKLQDWSVGATGKTAQFSVASCAEGTLNVRVARAYDVAGNGLGAVASRSVIVDRTAPVGTWVTVPRNPSNSSLLNFLVSWNEPAQVSGASILYSPNTVQLASMQTTAITTQFSLRFAADGAGSVSVGNFADTAGNIGSLAAVAVTVDTTPPTIVLTASATAFAASVVVTATASEPVTWKTPVSVTNGRITATTDKSSRVRQFTIQGINQGAVTVTAPRGSAVDQASWSSTAGNALTLTFDSVAPVISAVLVAGMPTTVHPGNALQVAVTTNEPLARITIQALGGGAVRTVCDTGCASSTVTYQLDAGTSTGKVRLQISAPDAAGNVGQTVLTTNTTFGCSKCASDLVVFAACKDLVDTICSVPPPLVFPTSGVAPLMVGVQAVAPATSSAYAFDKQPGVCDPKQVPFVYLPVGKSSTLNAVACAVDAHVSPLVNVPIIVSDPVELAAVVAKMSLRLTLEQPLGPSDLQSLTSAIASTVGVDASWVQLSVDVISRSRRLRDTVLVEVMVQVFPFGFVAESTLPPTWRTQAEAIRTALSALHTATSVVSFVTARGGNTDGSDISVGNAPAVGNSATAGSTQPASSDTLLMTLLISIPVIIIVCGVCVCGYCLWRHRKGLASYQSVAVAVTPVSVSSRTRVNVKHIRVSTSSGTPSRPQSPDLEKV